jgi:hypothetical protein
LFATQIQITLGKFCIFKLTADSYPAYSSRYLDRRAVLVALQGIRNPLILAILWPTAMF